MRRDEALVERYLIGLDLGAVVHEPDGNVPPDFVVGGQIAVEARRLNQHFESDGKHVGLETLEAPLIGFIETLLPTLGPPADGQSWWVHYKFRRPLHWRSLKRRIRATLIAFAPPAPKPTILDLAPGFRLYLDPKTDAEPDRFVLAGYSDFDAGGAVAAEILRSTRLCVAEKSHKIAAHMDRYPRWWLVLVDRIGPNLNPFERSALVGQVNKGPWEKIVLIDPAQPSRSLEL
ncbi:hypothetical protein BH10PSE4_BH10PSE4_44320 [soil metagenome]